MKELTQEQIITISHNLSNCLYYNNIEATTQLVELLKKVVHPKRLNSPEDYVTVYNDTFYTFTTWEELVKSEKEQADGWNENECRQALNNSIWMLPCGWYVQAV